MKVKEDDTGREMLAVLTAAADEYARADALSYLQNHLYRCPNGHVYLIGECGQAMQASLCPECGAGIGGGNHSLNPTNYRATETLDRMRQVAGA